MSLPRRLAPWLLVGAAALLPYLNALSCGFAYDDDGLIVTNRYVQPEAPWWQPLARPLWPPPIEAGLYRPVTGLTYRLQLGLHGPAPAPFHGFNVALHLGVTLLALAALRRLFPAHAGWAWGAALLFAVHPIHTEAVTGIVGRAELLAALFGLAGYLLWLGRGRGGAPAVRQPQDDPRRTPAAPGARVARWALLALCFALAAGSKESAVGWLLLLGAHRAGLLGDGRGYARIARGDRASLLAALAADAAVVAGLAAFFLARLAVLGPLLGPREVSLVDNPIYHAPLDVRVLTASHVLGRGILLMLWPAALCADYSFDAIQPVTSWASPAGLLLVALVAAAVCVARRAGRWPRRAWGLGAWIAFILPVSNLIAPIGTIMAERLLYLPSLGFLAALVALGQAALVRLRARRLGPALLIAAALLLGWRTWTRNPDWNSTLTLFEAAERVAPRSVRVLCNLGGSYSREMRQAEALAKFELAHQIAPDYHMAQKGLAHEYILVGRYQEAEALLRRTLAQRPRDGEAHYRLGNLLLEVERAQEALELFDRLLALEPESREGLVGHASALFMLERYAEAADAWQRAWDAHRRDPELGRHVAVAQVRAGRREAAIATLREVLTRAPGQPDLQQELDRLLGELGASAADRTAPEPE